MWVNVRRGLHLSLPSYKENANAGTNDVRSKSTDPAVQEMIAKAAKIGIKTVSGTVTKPCSPSAGSAIPVCVAATACRAPAGSILLVKGQPSAFAELRRTQWWRAAWDRAIPAGTRPIPVMPSIWAHTLLKLAKGQAKGYSIREVEKLRAVATPNEYSRKRPVR